MHKLVFQNLHVGDKPDLQHHLMLYLRVLLHPSGTKPFLPSPAHDVQTSAVATTLLLSCPWELLEGAQDLPRRAPHSESKPSPRWLLWSRYHLPLMTSRSYLL